MDARAPVAGRVSCSPWSGGQGARRGLEGSTGDSAVAAYQRREPERLRAEIAALYEAVADQGIAYANPPASFEVNGQKVRTPEQLLTNRIATCLDITALLAGLLELAGYRPLIVLKESHAYLAVWLQEEALEGGACTSSLTLKKRVDLGEMLVVEATGVAACPRVPFNQACRAAYRHFDTPSQFRVALDIRAARVRGIRPMPARDLAAFAPVVEQASAARSASQPADAAESQLPPVPRPSDELDLSADVAMPRLERWKRKLLDLTRRNRLLNFRDNAKALRLECASLSELENALSSGKRFEVFPDPAVMAKGDPRDADLHRRRTGQDAAESFILAEMRNGKLYSPVGEEELTRRLVEISRADRLSVEETGANTLFLAMGFLRWYESETDEKPNLAPIILVPLLLERKSARKGFRISLLDEESRINVTLVEKLKVDFGIAVTGLDPLPVDDSGLDVDGILTQFRRAVKPMARWDVVEDAAIAVVTFTKFLMWLDLEANAELLKRNPIVRHLIETPEEPYSQPATIPKPEELDRDLAPSDILCPLDADSSQLVAVLAAERGCSFVLQGPPGTGKSQTIANLIAHCVAKQKRVLFVSEKMAALRVVQRRLQAVGLGPFCLELHSRKANKHDFCAQLTEALKVQPLTASPAWEKETTKLGALRAELNGVVAALHEEREFGQSAHWTLDTTLRHEALPDAGVSVACEKSAEVFESAIEGLRRVRDRATTTGCRPEHPLRELRALSWHVDTPAEVSRTCAAVVSAAHDLGAAASAALPRLRLGKARWCRYVLDVGTELCALLTQAPPVAEALLRAAEWESLRLRLYDLIESGRDRDASWSRLSQTYTEAMLELPLDLLEQLLAQRQQAGFISRLFLGLRIRRALRPTMKIPVQRSWEVLAEDVQLARTVVRRHGQIASLADVTGLLGAEWRDGSPDWDTVAAMADWATRFRKVLSDLDFGDPDQGEQARGLWIGYAATQRDLTSADAPLGKAFAAMCQAHAHFLAAWKQAVDLLHCAAAAPVCDTGADDHLGTVVEACARWQSATDELRSWAAFQEARAEAIRLGLTGVVELLEQGRVSAADVPAVGEKAMAKRCLGDILSRDQRLKSFFGREHGARITDFRELDLQVRDHSAQIVFAELSKQVLQQDALSARYATSEAGKLQRYAKGGRFTIRRVFADCPNALARLKPCVLMSPLSVAQFMGADFPPFDLVVFDEASQMPPWEAVGAIARGRQVIVVGDSKQLPPTTFFERSTDEEDFANEDEVTDLESILDECTVCRLPALPLLWHYRSRHESLIAFSNGQYYSGDLQTFPSAANQVERLGVVWREIPDGWYDAGHSRTNGAEAEAVVREIVTRLSDPEQRQYSIGVVTFSIAQQRAIEDLLEQARLEHPVIDPYFTESVQEPVFVKNLETVQGDERDTMLFSICYGPTRTGSVSMNFGPLNGRGGERRLNVAVTRARRELIVFSTLRPDHIDLSRTQAVGVRHLKAFLEYARGQGQVVAGPSAGTGPAPASPLERSVRDALSAKGWDLDCAVGCSGYRVDLAVRHPSLPGHYVLGIECDGENYRSGVTARDRDRLRRQVLSQLGWQLERVWVQDWCLSRKREVDRLDQAIRAAVAAYDPRAAVGRDAGCNAQIAEDAVDADNGDGGTKPPPQAPRSAPPAEAPAPPRYADNGSDSGQPVVVVAEPAPAAYGMQGRTTYRAAQLPLVDRGPASFSLPAADARIKERILLVLEAEAPIHPELLVKRVAESWGIGRMSPKVQERILAMVPQRGVRLVRTPTRSFLWPSSQTPATYALFRVPGDHDEPRPAEYISPEEVANAMAALLRHHLSMGCDDLLRAAAEEFGISRLGSRVRASMEEGLVLLEAQSRCRRENDTVSAR